jgi:hypothetical protein
MWFLLGVGAVVAIVILFFGTSAGRQRSSERQLRDAIDGANDLLAKRALEQLAKDSAAIEALSTDELRSRLRARLFTNGLSSESLATCSLPIGTGHELRVVLDGFDIAGIPSIVRGRFTETDDALRELALDATLGSDAPSLAAGHTDAAREWLARPARWFGDVAHVVAADGDGLAWIAVAAATGPTLCRLCAASLASRRLKGVLFVWDGARLSTIGIVGHSVRGPHTPDYTLRMDAATADLIGLELDARGAVGIRRGV